MRLRRPTRLSRKGAKFIAGFEGFSARPYRDAVGVLTQGYGHTGSGIGGTWSPAKGLRVMRSDADTVAQVVRGLPIKLNQQQFDALVSFGFNLGTGYFASGHTIGDAIRRRNYRAIADAFLLYDQADGHALPGLTRRRHAERRLFLSK